MWQLNSTALPTTVIDSTAVPIAYFDTGGNFAPLGVIDLQAAYTLPGVQVNRAPTTQLTTTQAGNTVVTSGLAQVDAITLGSILYTPAVNPSAPTVTEFVWSQVAQTATFAASLPIGLPVQVLGGVSITPTDIIDSSILAVFYGLPVVAELKWTLTAENHPTGSINLRAIGDDACALVDQRFKKGTEITFAGIGFSVSNYTKKLLNTRESPGRVWDISVSLGGKWERRPYTQPAYIIPAANPPGLDDTPYTDPECQLLRTPAERLLYKPTRVSVRELADRVGADFVGFSSAATQQQIFDRVGVKPFPTIQAFSTIIPITPSTPLDVWSIPVARDLPRGATAHWLETADSLKRQNGCYLDFTQPSAVYAKDLNSGARWAYAVVELSIALKGDCTHSPGIEGYAAEYRAVKLSGQFSEPINLSDEDSQGSGNGAQARWQNREIKIKTLKSGDPNPDYPPENFVLIKNMSQNFDTSGPTKEEVLVTTWDGVEMLKHRRVWGAAYNSDQVIEVFDSEANHGPVLADAADFWRVCQEETTATLYESGTRYITGSVTNGFRKGRYKQETDQLEILGLLGGDAESSYEASLYRFNNYPIYAGEQKVLQQFGSYYSDAQRTPVPSDLQKRCHPDGSSSMVAVPNPNYSEPMFEQAHLSYRNSFSHTVNPDSAPDAPLPDLTQGEEMQTYRRIEILPSKATTTEVFGNLANFKGFDTSDDLFVESVYEISSQGAQFADYASKRSFSTNSGRPGAAQRLADRYEKVEPEVKSGSPGIYKNPVEAEFEYILCTPGHSPNDPSTGSVSYQYARYLHQGITGAETDLKYRDILESVDYNATIPANFQIRPLDYLVLNDGVNTYHTRVKSIENTIYLQGDVAGYPVLVAPQATQIQAGIDRDIPVTLHRRSTPKTTAVFNARVFGLTIGEIIPPTLQGRGNY